VPPGKNEGLLNEVLCHFLKLKLETHRGIAATKVIQGLRAANVRERGSLSDVRGSLVDDSQNIVIAPRSLRRKE